MHLPYHLQALGTSTFFCCKTFRWGLHRDGGLAWKGRVVASSHGSHLISGSDMGYWHINGRSTEDEWDINDQWWDIEFIYHLVIKHGWGIPYEWKHHVWMRNLSLPHFDQQRYIVHKYIFEYLILRISPTMVYIMGWAQNGNIKLTSTVSKKR